MAACASSTTLARSEADSGMRAAQSRSRRRERSALGSARAPCNVTAAIQRIPSGRRKQRMMADATPSVAPKQPCPQPDKQTCRQPLFRQRPGQARLRLWRRPRTTLRVFSSIALYSDDLTALADGLSRQVYPSGREVGPRINSTIEREEQRTADNAGLRQWKSWPTSVGSKAKSLRLPEGRSACFRLADLEQVED